MLDDHDVDRDPDCSNGCKAEQKFRPEEVKIHESYNPSTFKNDIALIRLNGLVETVIEDPQSSVLPACLPDDPKEIYNATSSYNNTVQYAPETFKMWNQISAISNGQKLSFLAISEVLILDVSKFEQFLESQIYPKFKVKTTLKL